MLRELKKLKILISLAALSMIVGVAAVAAQDVPDTQVRTLTVGQKYKIKGVVISKTDDILLVRDSTGVSTKILVTPATSIKSNGFFGGDRYAPSSIVRGLPLKVEGRGDTSGALAAKKIPF